MRLRAAGSHRKGAQTTRANNKGAKLSMSSTIAGLKAFGVPNQVNQQHNLQNCLNQHTKERQQGLAAGEKARTSSR